MMLPASDKGSLRSMKLSIKVKLKEYQIKLVIVAQKLDYLEKILKENFKEEF